MTLSSSLQIYFTLWQEQSTTCKSPCLSAGQLVSRKPGGVVEGRLFTFFFSLHLLETKYGGHRVQNEGSLIAPNLLTNPL